MNNEIKQSLNQLESITSELIEEYQINAEEHLVKHRLAKKRVFDHGQYQIHELNRYGAKINSYKLPNIDSDYVFDSGTGELPGEWQPSIPLDAPAIYGEGISPSVEKAALFVSDFHMSDDTVGDDFLFNHLIPLAESEIFVGNPDQGPSKSVLFQHVISFVSAELQKMGISKFDMVLNGDIYDIWEMEGRGTSISTTHNGFAAACGKLQVNGNSVYYVRGNHDSIIPDGPWTKVDTYKNTRLKVKAEHGHNADSANSGVNNPIGSTVTHSVSAIEFVRINLKSKLTYLLSGIDNVRPTSAAATFILVRAGMFGPFSKSLNLMAGVFQKLFRPRRSLKDFIKAIRRFLSALFTGYLKVEGHTHDVVRWPRVYYNTGTWTGKLRIAPDKTESFSEECPFLLVYKDPQTGKRIERFLIAV